MDILSLWLATHLFTLVNLICGLLTTRAAVFGASLLAEEYQTDAGRDMPMTDIHRRASHNLEVEMQRVIAKHKLRPLLFLRIPISGEVAVVGRSLHLRYIVLAVNNCLNGIFLHAVELNAPLSTAVEAVCLNCVELISFKCAGCHHEQSFGNFGAHCRHIRNLLAQLVVAHYLQESGSRIYARHAFDIFATEIRRASDTCSGVSDAIGHYILLLLAYKNRRTDAEFERQQLAIDDDKTRRLCGGCFQYVSLAAEGGEVLKKLRLRLQEVKSLN